MDRLKIALVAAALISGACNTIGTFFAIQVLPFKINSQWLKETSLSTSTIHTCKYKCHLSRSLCVLLLWCSHCSFTWHENKGIRIKSAKDSQRMRRSKSRIQRLDYSFT